MAEGDNNTIFYHVTTLIRRRKNHINLIKNNNGEWTEDHEDIQKLFKSWYQNLYTIEFGVEDWMQTNTRFIEIEEN